MSARTIRISDSTLCHTENNCSFKDKIDIVSKLAGLGTDIIELPRITNVKTDTLLAHTVAPLLENCALYCDGGYSDEDVENAWNAVKTCSKNGIVIALPVSTVQKEYSFHKKAASMLKTAVSLVKKAASFGCDVEFKAIDATRADAAFVKDIIKAVCDAGASSVTVCDSTGTMLPDEFTSFLKDIMTEIPNDTVSLGVECSDKLSLGCALALSAANLGVSSVTVCESSDDAPSVCSVAEMIKVRGAKLGAYCGIGYEKLNKTVGEIRKILDTKRKKSSPFDSGVKDIGGYEIKITADDTLETVASFASKLGYELNEEDSKKVFENAHRLAAKKPIGAKELEAVIASSSMQVPATYIINSYVINSGNLISATAHIELEKEGKVLSGVSIGDGPIDAAFLSIEQITGRHYELDDFQIKSVTEGREAVGEALVKLRSNGKLYSGHGISTDIIGASIRAYIKALNKITYEENH